MRITLPHTLFAEGPHRSYRPPPGHPGRGGDDPGAGRPEGPRLPWTWRDMAAAAAIYFAVLYFAIFIAEIVDALREDDSDFQFPVAITVVFIALVLSVVIAIVSRIRLIMLAGMLVAVTGLIIAVRLASTTGTGDGDLFGLPVGFVESAISSSMFMVIAWLYSGVKYHVPARALGFVRPSSSTAYLLAIGAWVLALIANGVWYSLTSEIEALEPPDNTAEALELAGNSLLPAWLLVGLLAPFAEEVFFRGFILNGLRQRLNGITALLLSSAIFALFHVAPGLYAPTFLLGLALGFVYLKTRSIWPSIFIHALHNTFAIVTTWQDLGT